MDPLLRLKSSKVGGDVTKLPHGGPPSYNLQGEHEHEHEEKERVMGGSVQSEAMKERELPICSTQSVSLTPVD